MRFLLAFLVLVPGCVPFFDATPSGELADGAADVGADADATDDLADSADLGNPDADIREYNACGGEEILRFEGVTGTVGRRCGECGSGFLICNGPNQLRCEGDTPRNACGRCGELPFEPGTECGECSPGAWACAADRVECQNASARNVCGGCEQLDGEPGFSCGGEGTFQCSDRNEVQCEPGSRNACGGIGALVDDSGEPAFAGDRCGPCADGVLVCSPREDGTLTCANAGPANGCGGCAILEAEPGTRCGPCGGEWECDGPNRVECNAEPPNRCGGCAFLAAVESCPSGSAVCVGPNETQCVEASRESNQCGGSVALGATVGSSCGTCESGLVACSGVNDTECVGDEGVAARNGCGGCGELPAPLGTPCEGCGTWSCADQAAVCDRSDCE